MTGGGSTRPSPMPTSASEYSGLDQASPFDVTSAAAATRRRPAAGRSPPASRGSCGWRRDATWCVHMGPDPGTPPASSPSLTRTSRRTGRHQRRQRQRHSTQSVRWVMQVATFKGRGSRPANSAARLLLDLFSATDRQAWRRLSWAGRRQSACLGYIRTHGVDPAGMLGRAPRGARPSLACGSSPGTAAEPAARLSGRRGGGRWRSAMGGGAGEGHRVGRWVGVVAAGGGVALPLWVKSRRELRRSWRAVGRGWPSRPTPSRLVVGDVVTPIARSSGGCPDLGQGAGGAPGQSGSGGGGGGQPVRRRAGKGDLLDAGSGPRCGPRPGFGAGPADHGVHRRTRATGAARRRCCWSGHDYLLSTTSGRGAAEGGRAAAGATYRSFIAWGVLRRQNLGMLSVDAPSRAPSTRPT